MTHSPGNTSGMTNLTEMLTHLTVTSQPGEFVFVVVDSLERAAELDPSAIIKEAEGFTAIVHKETADQHDLTYDFVASWLTLDIHSSLEAVGLTAAFSAALTSAGISCNVVAGNYHDHILVPVATTKEAIDVLRRLAR